MEQLKTSQIEVPPSYIECPITHTVIDNPAVATDGNTYEKASLESWLVRKQTSPLDGLPLVEIFPNQFLIESHSMHKLISEAKR